MAAPIKIRRYPEMTAIINIVNIDSSNTMKTIAKNTAAGQNSTSPAKPAQ
jgi:hypothetical protein